MRNSILYLPYALGGDDDILVGGKGTQAGNRQFPAQDDNHDPRRHLLPANQRHQGSRDQKLVSNRVQQFAPGVLSDSYCGPGGHRANR